MTTGKASQTYYEILELSREAKPIEIKKAYRRLALKHHPDRNNGSTDSTEKFKAIGEAYETLSDTSLRSQYDESLRYPSANSTQSFQRRRQQTSAGGFDPFSQFDTLFRTDPFFQDAFREMDDAFAQRFQNENNNTTTRDTPAAAAPQKSKESWGMWLLRQCGVQVQVTSYRATGDGGFAATSYSNNPHQNVYTNKQTKRYTDSEGRTVMVQSIERNGNRIEDKYINQTLVERKVNGIVEPLERITHS